MYLINIGKTQGPYSEANLKLIYIPALLLVLAMLVDIASLVVYA